MKPEAQRIAIAKYLGWRESQRHESGADNKSYITLGWTDKYGAFHKFTPDYLNDLNACMDMQNSLSHEKREDYALELCSVCAEDFGLNEAKLTVTDDMIIIAYATAAQRAEAFLRTMGLWRDDA